MAVNPIGQSGPELTRQLEKLKAAMDLVREAMKTATGGALALRPWEARMYRL